MTVLTPFTIQHGQTVKMSLAVGAVRDTAGNTNASSLNLAVTNNVPRPPAVITGVAITSYPGMDNNYATNDDIEVTATFDQAVAVTGTPRIDLELEEAVAEAGGRSTQAARGARRSCSPTRCWPRTNPTPTASRWGRLHF